MKVSPQSAKLDRFLADQVYRFLAARLLLGDMCVSTRLRKDVPSRIVRQLGDNLSEYYLELKTCLITRSVPGAQSCSRASPTAVKSAL